MKKLKWLIQPTKVERDKVTQLIDLLEKAQIAYDIVYPLEGQILNPDKTPYVFEDNFQYFVCGSYPLSRYVYKKMPSAVFSLEDYDTSKIYNIFGKENFINSDAILCHTNDIVWHQEELFIRPQKDDKSFNGGIYNKNMLTFSGDVVVSSIKHISKEYRFFVIDGSIITGSLYKVNGIGQSSPIIDMDAQIFAESMIDKFNTNEKKYSYVIDVAKVVGENIEENYKIMELNCLNAAGFYDINLYKLVCAVSDYYEQHFSVVF